MLSCSLGISHKRRQQKKAAIQWSSFSSCGQTGWIIDAWPCHQQLTLWRRCNNSFSCRSWRKRSSSFTLQRRFYCSFLWGLCFDCLIHAGVCCVLFCPVPVILCKISRAVSAFKKKNQTFFIIIFFLLCGTHIRVQEQDLAVQVRTSLELFSYFAVHICIILYCLPVHWWLDRERGGLAYFWYSALLQFSFPCSFCNFSSPPWTSHPTFMLQVSLKASLPSHIY